MNIKYLPVPRTFHLQWHVTDLCNLRCKHCYRNENPANELSKEDIFSILESYAELSEAWGIAKANNRISWTGGEPLLRKDFFEILEKCQDYSNIFRLNLMSNGTTITDSVASRIKELKIESVQVSIEGLEETNDAIRGQGTYKNIMKAFEILSNFGLHPAASLTVSRANIKDILDAAEECRKAGADCFGVSRLIPIGTGGEMESLMLSPLEYREMLKMMEKANRHYESLSYNFRIIPGCSTELWETEGIKFRGCTRSCSSGFNSLTILHEGSVLPCRRLPEVVGNLKSSSLFEIFYRLPFLWKLRNGNNINEKCKSCSYYEKCGGPAKCMSSVYFNNPFAPDPNCWHLFKEMPKKNSFPAQPESKEFRTSEKLFSISSENSAPLKEPEEYVGKRIEISASEMEAAKERLSKAGNAMLILKIAKSDMNPESGGKIIKNIAAIKKLNPDIRVSIPLPRCMSGIGNMGEIRKLGIPRSCTECHEFFSNGKLCKAFDESLTSEIMHYITKKQALEYIEITKKDNINEKCSSCIWRRRGICDLKCCQSTQS